jgi:protein-S-isoprenylcysteine O-methyltransferase
LFSGLHISYGAPASHLLFTTPNLSCVMAAHPAGAPSDSDAFEQRIRERELLNSRPLETIPDPSSAKPHGSVPNTPLAASTISFLLGSTFTFGFLIFLSGGFSSYWFATHQLGFFIASWSAFHWGEFAVTAGWNREKVSVDCTHFSHGVCIF